MDENYNTMAIDLRNDPEMMRVSELYSVISDALKEAGEFGLQTEVVYSALKIMSTHPEAAIYEVIRAAMVEWDVW